MSYKVILWDIDGTILDFKAAEKVAIRVGFARLGLGVITDMMIEDYSRINAKWWKYLEKGEYTKPEILVGRFKEFFSKYGIDESKAEEFNKNYQIDLGDTIAFFDDAPNIIKAIKIPQYGATNGTKIAQSKKIKEAGLDKLLEAVFISDEVGYEKPTIEYFNHVFKAIEDKYGPINRSDIVIIGDSLTSDIQGGNNAGIATIWYNKEHQVNTTNLRIDYEIDDLHQLFDILEIE
ncbi:MAG: YjjG family noncanonical pyrimidine nucleotidase [Bacilli bacterium]|nr:YjjG family noncanonical pyrimidine nucleotidase [Bacilli bacterium]